MPSTLKNVRLNRIDLVDAPANPSARVMLVKRNEEDEDAAEKERQRKLTEKTAPGVGAVHVPVPQRRSSYMAEKQDTLVKRFLALVKDMGGSSSFVPGGGAPGLPAAPGESDHVAKLAELHGHMTKALEGLPPEHPMHAITKAFGEHLAAMTKTEAPISMSAAGGGMDEEDVKKINEFIEKRTSALSAETAELRKSLKASEDARVASDAIAKAERDTRELGEVKADLKKFTSLTLDVEKEAPLYKAVRESNRPAYDSMLATLAASDAVSKTAAGLERTIGSGVPGSSSPHSAWAEIEAEAGKLLAKGDSKLTKAAAINKVMENPEHFKLVKRYQDEGGANDPVIVS